MIELAVTKKTADYIYHFRCRVNQLISAIFNGVLDLRSAVSIHPIRK